MLENPMIRECRHQRVEPTNIYTRPVRCSCGCGYEIVDGWEWEGDYFYDEGCVVLYMKKHGILKAVEL